MRYSWMRMVCNGTMPLTYHLLGPITPFLVGYESFEILKFSVSFADSRFFAVLTWYVDIIVEKLHQIRSWSFRGHGSEVDGKSPGRCSSPLGQLSLGRYGRGFGPCGCEEGLVFWDEFVHAIGTKIKMLLPLGPAVSLPCCDVSLY